MRGSKRGFTLAEVLISAGMALSICLSAALLYFLILRKLLWLQEASDRQIVGIQALQSVTADLRKSAGEAVSLLGLDALAIGVQLTPENGGERRWREFPLVYGNLGASAPVLIRAEHRHTSNTLIQPPELESSRLSTVLAGDQGWTRKSFPGCRLQKVALVGERIRFSIALQQRRWDGENEVQVLSGEVGYEL